MNATTMLPTNPYSPTTNIPPIRPPRKAPMSPTTMSPTSPYPPLPMTRLARNPAMRPTTSQAMTPPGSKTIVANMDMAVLPCHPAKSNSPEAAFRNAARLLLGDRELKVVGRVGPGGRVPGHRCRERAQGGVVGGLERELGFRLALLDGRPGRLDGHAGGQVGERQGNVLVERLVPLDADRNGLRLPL